MTEGQQKPCPQTTQFAFVKPDLSVVRMERDEFYALKDLSAIDGATYYSLRHAGQEDYLIGYGHVNAANPEGHLEITSYMTGGLSPNGFSLTGFKERLLVCCALGR